MLPVKKNRVFHVANLSYGTGNTKLHLWSMLMMKTIGGGGHREKRKVYRPVAGKEFGLDEKAGKKATFKNVFIVRLQHERQNKFL
jgi:hypothetical protein